LTEIRRSQELLTKIGDHKLAAGLLCDLGWLHLSLGELGEAKALACKAMPTLQELGVNLNISRIHLLAGTVALCRRQWQDAVTGFEAASPFLGETGWNRARIENCLGRTCLAQGDREAARCHFAEAIRRDGPASWSLAGLEEACPDPTVFRAFCVKYRDTHPDKDDPRNPRWFLEAAEPGAFPQRLITDRLSGPPEPTWQWEDPFGDCARQIGEGLEIKAANGRDLWHLNMSAPRLLRAASGDFAVQLTCAPASAEKPAIGGLLLWKDQENFLRWERGGFGPNEVWFGGVVRNREQWFGRGRLRAERIILRLERQGSRVSALCSADGGTWFTAGHTEFAVEEPVKLGPYAIGMIDRTIYPGAYPDGTSTRFEQFEFWE
jgi:hypothetical protein